MELRFAHLADYAAAASDGKLTIVGVFDIVWDSLQDLPIPLPACFLVANFAGSISEGTAHELEVRLVDPDEVPVIDPIRVPLNLRPTGPGYPLRAQVLLGFGPGVLKVPRRGDYLFRFLVDGLGVGELSLAVREPPPQA